MLVWLDQPYYYTTATMDQRWTHVGTCSVSAVSPRATAKSVAWNFTGYLTKTFGSDGGPVPSGARAILGFRFYTAEIQGAIQMVRLTKTSRTQMAIYVNLDGTFDLMRGTQYGWESVASSVYALATGTWYYVEFDVLLDGTTGEVHIYIDGVERLSYAGNTLGLDGSGNPLDATWNGVQFGAQQIGTLSHVTDIIVMDGVDGTATQGQPFNAPLGDTKVEYLAGQSDAVGGVGTYTQWALSGGTDQGALVDDGSAGPDGDATYLSDATTGHRFSVKLENLPSTAVDVLAVAPVHSLTKSDAGARQIKPLFYISGGGANPYLGTAIEVPSQGTYRVLMEIFGKNPATGAAWTPSEVNALEVGAEVQ